MRSLPPSPVDPIITEAVMAARSGAHASAARLACDALRQDPGHPAALSVLGLAQFQLGHFARSTEIFSDLVKAQPDEPRNWLNLGVSLRADRRPNEALQAYLSAAERGAGGGRFFLDLAFTLIECRDPKRAARAFSLAYECQPSDAETAIAYAEICIERLRYSEARRVLQNWRRLDRLTTDHVAVLAGLMQTLGSSEEASAAIEWVKNDASAAAGSLLTLVHVLERGNRLSEATELLHRARESHAPPRAEALALAEARLAARRGEHAQARAGYEAALRANPADPLRFRELFSLARSLDALGDYEGAFVRLTEAHQLQGEYFDRLSIEAASANRQLELATRECNPIDVQKWDDAGAPSGADSPVFVVGFPRSGTTLLEQVLDAHPLLQSMDEQPFLQQLIDRLVKGGWRYPEDLGMLTQGECASLRAQYWALVSGCVKLTPHQRLIDKNPLNVLRLPLIRRLFPHADIVLLVRHPCDALLSCFMQEFGAPEFARLCADLPTLAGGYRRVFDFWYAQSALLQPARLEVRYERLVCEFEGSVVSLAKFLQLPVEAAMFEPARHAQAKPLIGSPSYTQVVAPITERAIGRWRAYERHFTCLEPQLRPYLERWGYRWT